MPLEVEGLEQLQKLFAKADRDVRLAERKAMRDVAEPVRRDVETLTYGQIRNMPRSPKWSAMRTGVTQKLVYVAPRQRGLGRGDHPAKRPNLAVLIRTRAMDPAEQKNMPVVRARFEQLLDQIAAGFNQG
jgi:hypothetical protein